MSSLLREPVAVTGADGFLGNHVVEALRGQDVEVIEVVGPRGTKDRAPVRKADLRRAEDAAGAVAGAASVVHLAARSGGIQLQQAGAMGLFHDNVSMTHNVLSAAAADGCGRVFLASSAVVYSSLATEHPLTESARTISPPREDVDAYAWGKLTDEQLGRWVGRDRGLEVVVGRFDNVYGPGASFDPSRSTVVHALAKKAVDAAPNGVVEVWGTGKAQRSFVHVRDAARAVVTVLDIGESGRPYNISATGGVMIADLAERLAELAGDDMQLRFRPDKPDGEPRRVLDPAALQGLGFEATVSVGDGLQEVVDEYQRTDQRGSSVLDRSGSGGPS